MDILALRTRLREAPFDFLSAVSNSSLHDFQEQWSTLQADADKALRLSMLSEEDILLAHATATVLATSADFFVKTDDEVSRRTSVFVDEMEDVFARLSISDVTHSPHSPAHYRAPRSSNDTAPPYIPTAYDWITRNIHNPYPSSEVKECISRDAGRPLRVITDWFKSVRRHVGWVAICKTHFQGSRASAVQAAKHVYLQTTPQTPLSSDIVSQFEAIRIRLRDMYLHIDGDDLSDSSEDSFLSSSFVSPSRRSPSNQSLYARSRSSSSTPSLVFSTDDEDTRSSLSGYTPPSAPQSTPSRKRRLSVAATEWEDTASTPSSTPTCDPHPPLRLPKRRLSVSDSQPTPKRPCLPPTVGPRKQAVSTPFPIAHQITPAVDEWFPFELSDTSLSVELFNWDMVAENDVFLYNSLFDNILQSDGQNFSNVTLPSDAHESPTSLDLGVSSAVDPSVLDVSSAFEAPHTQLTAPVPSPPGPITATITPVFDFLDAFLSSVNVESAEPHTTQSSSSPSTELSLNDTIDLFGESVVMP